jgi:hypothetical protein
VLDDCSPKLYTGAANGTLGGKMTKKDTGTATADAGARSISLVPEAIEPAFDLDALLAPYHVERRTPVRREATLHLVGHPRRGE